MITAKIVRKKHKTLPTSIKGPRRVKVGFPAGAADGGNISKAVWNEFGTKGGASGGGWGGPIPERPFMRNSVRKNHGKYRAALKTSAAKILRGDTALGVVMSKLGIVAQGDIQAEITSLSSPPNSPVTIARKGSSKPLIDSGEMRGAVTYKVDG
jgi:hypothetical protein